MDYEKLGAFYLGRVHDLATGETTSETLLYDAKDLTTHAVIIGMTGSGKTGLGIDLLEEALIDGIPVIAIDPKGDLGNMLLAFPDLAPGDFRPWIDEAEAARKGRTADEHAKATAELWRDGLARWDQPPERIRRYVDACERAIYTPGSTAGRPIAVLRSLAAPGPAVMDDADALRERIGAAAASLLGLLGVDADPLRSREHILLSTLLQHAWTAGRDLDLPTHEVTGHVQHDEDLHELRGLQAEGSRGNPAQRAVGLTPEARHEDEQQQREADEIQYRAPTLPPVRRRAEHQPAEHDADRECRQVAVDIVQAVATRFTDVHRR